MSRPPKCRRVEFVPNLTYFKPAGVPIRELSEVSVTIEELEAIRLKDLLGLEQEACAERMGVSRPTYHRILAAARGKVAEALINGKAIRVEGGNFKMASRLYRCGACSSQWESPCGQGRSSDEICPNCQNRDIYRVNSDGTLFNCQRWKDGKEI